MQSTNSAYPVRMFIRHKAQVKLASAITHHHIDPPVDALLFQDITGTLLQPAVHPDVYCAYPNRDAAMQVEEQVSSEIADTYVRIKRQQSDPLVQQLNDLL